MKKRSKPKLPKVWYCLYDKDGFAWYHFDKLKKLHGRLEELANAYPELSPWEIVKYTREVKGRRAK